MRNFLLIHTLLFQTTDFTRIQYKKSAQQLMLSVCYGVQEKGHTSSGCWELLGALTSEGRSLTTRRPRGSQGMPKGSCWGKLRDCAGESLRIGFGKA